MILTESILFHLFITTRKRISVILIHFFSMLLTGINGKGRKKRHVNWHETAACALQIDLKDYASSLEYMAEYKLGRGSYRIDIFVIKKLTRQTIPVAIANLFRTFNLFEVKGIGSYYPPQIDYQQNTLSHLFPQVRRVFSINLIFFCCYFS